MINKEELKKIANDFYTSLYLIKTKKILQKNTKKQNTVLRFTHFNKTPIFVSGINICLEIIKTCLKTNINKINVWACKEGQKVNAGQPILVISGNYQLVATLENVLDGIIARCSSVTTNCKQVLTLLKSNQIISMADRSDLYVNQPFDGYASYIAGIRNFTTQAQISLFNDKNVKVVGTIPHALIQQFNGDLKQALIAYNKTFPKEKLTALVDYVNNVLDTIEKIKDLKNKIGFIRIDTSLSLKDECVKNIKDAYGINSALVKKARQKLDSCGMKNTKIIVSSGLNYDRIKKLLAQNAPIDFFGVGKSFLKIECNITCDLIFLNNKPQAKFGRAITKDFKDYVKNLKKYI